MHVLEGRARVFGDDINTDYIIASSRKRETLDPSILGRYIFEALDPDFADSVRPGDIIVAGRNFGCGSAMEVAVTVLLAVGVRAVVAESFARGYFRNSINNGLAPLVCETGRIRERDRLRIEIGRRSSIRNESRDFTLEAQSLPPDVCRILESGGLVPFFRDNGGFCR